MHGRVIKLLLKSCCFRSDRCRFAHFHLVNTRPFPADLPQWSIVSWYISQKLLCLLLIELLCLSFHMLFHILIRTCSYDLSIWQEHVTFCFILKEKTIRWKLTLIGFALEASCCGIMSAVNHFPREGVSLPQPDAWTRCYSRKGWIYRRARITSFVKAHPNPLSNPASLGSIPTAGVHKRGVPMERLWNWLL